MARGMPRDLLIAIGAGGLSSLMTLSVVTGSPLSFFLVYLGSLPLYLAGLGFGFRAAGVAALVGAATTAFSAGPLAGVLFAGVSGLPAFMVTVLALRNRLGPEGQTEWYAAGNILAQLTALGAAFLAFAALLTMGSDGGFEGAIRLYLGDLFAAMMPQLSELDRRDMTDVLAPAFPGAVLTSWLLMSAVNGGLAQWVLARSGRAIRPSPAFAELDLPQWSALLLVGAGIMALFGPGPFEYVGRNLALVLAAPFFFVGLAVVHALTRRVPFPGMFLAAFYVFVVLLSGFAALLLTGLGFLEQWACLRRRFAGPDKGQEDE